LSQIFYKNQGKNTNNTPQPTEEVIDLAQPLLQKDDIKQETLTQNIPEESVVSENINS
jgi:hypothetical protein